MLPEALGHGAQTDVGAKAAARGGRNKRGEMVSKSTVETMLKRIEVASIASPIAVFRLPASESEGKFLDSVFAGTTTTQRELKNSRPGLVGVYNRRHSTDRIKAELTAALAASKEEN